MLLLRWWSGTPAVDDDGIYVGIFAWRYGYVPPAAVTTDGDQAAASPRISITEAEFRRAAGKRPLVFLLDPKANWPVQYVTVRDLRRWLGDDLQESSVEQDGDVVSNELLRSIIGWPHPFIPITEGGNLRKVVARASVADNLARIFVESLDRTRA